MSSFSASSVVPAAVSPGLTFGVSPSAVPLSPLLSRAALACVGRVRYAVGLMSRNYSLLPLRSPTASASARALAFSGVAFGRPLSLGRLVGVASVCGFRASARRGRRLASADFSPMAVACGPGSSSLSPAQCGAFRGALTSALPSWLAAASARPNPPVNLAPFGRWTLRDKAAQRRLPAR